MAAATELCRRLASLAPVTQAVTKEALSRLLTPEPARWGGPDRAQLRQRGLPRRRRGLLRKTQSFVARALRSVSRRPLPNPGFCCTDRGPRARVLLWNEGMSTTEKKIDLSESVAGEEDPGAFVDMPVSPGDDAPGHARHGRGRLPQLRRQRAQRDRRVPRVQGHGQVHVRHWRRLKAGCRYSVPAPAGCERGSRQDVVAMQLGYHCRHDPRRRPTQSIRVRS